MEQFLTEDLLTSEELSPGNWNTDSDSDCVTSNFPSSTLLQLQKSALIIESATKSQDVRQIVNVIRLIFRLRPKLTQPMLCKFLDIVLPAGSVAHSKLISNLSGNNSENKASGTTVPVIPEFDAYCSLLVLLFLLYDDERWDEAASSSKYSINRRLKTKSLPDRILDFLSSILYFYCSYAHELNTKLSEIRGELMLLHHKAALRSDKLSQEILLNLLLRNYLHYNLYDKAEKFRSKTPRFEVCTNNQLCRYLFYLGKIRTIQSEYTDAKESLLQADRIAPVAAWGFRIQCNKWAILVCLLLGEIPERRIFMQKGMEKALRPYFELTNAVRIGDVELFRNVAEGYGSTFCKDKTQNVIVRLRHSVIRTGLCNISISYSRISLADVAEKLRLSPETPVADVERIIAKAIRDGAIDATLDHAKGWMMSKEPHDTYSTNEPQAAFHSRITTCIKLHNEAVRALYIPPDTPEDEDEESKARRLSLQQIDEDLAKAEDD